MFFLLELLVIDILVIRCGKLSIAILSQTYIEEQEESARCLYVEKEEMVVVVVYPVVLHCTVHCDVL